jgi:WD40 repeat protein
MFLFDFLILETELVLIHIYRPWSRHDKFSVLIAGEGRAKLNSDSGGISNNEGLFSVTYASVYDNTVLRTFSGHSSKVTNLSMSPVDDRFLSSSDDRTIRLWNIQQPGCIAMIPPIPNGNSDTTAPYACFDSSGLVFAVTSSLPGTSGNVGSMSVFFAYFIFLLL